MADFSISVLKGQAAENSPFALTVGTSAPGAGQIELRVDLTTVPATKRDVLLALDTLKMYFESSVTGLDMPIPNINP